MIQFTQILKKNKLKFGYWLEEFIKRVEKNYQETEMELDIVNEDNI